MQAQPNGVDSGVNFITLHLPPRWKVSPRSHFDHASLVLSTALPFTNLERKWWNISKNLLMKWFCLRENRGVGVGVEKGNHRKWCFLECGCSRLLVMSLLQCVYSYAISEWVTRCFLSLAECFYRIENAAPNIYVLLLQGFLCRCWKKQHLNRKRERKKEIKRWN